MEQTVQLSIVAVYFLAVFGIGLVASRKIHDLKDFFVGGKKMSYWVVAFSARATGESGWLLLGLTGFGALMGMRAMWVVFGEVLGVAVCWICMSHRFKELTDRFGSVTIPDYLESRLGDKTHLVRVISALALVIFPTIYISAQLDATGKAFESFLGWDYSVGLTVGFLVVLAYTVAGGFIAVAWSDLIQGMLMLVGLVMLPIAGIVYLGGLGSLWAGLEQLPGGLTSIWGSEGLKFGNLAGIVSLFAIGFGFLGSPQIFVRFIALRDPRELKKGTIVAIVWTLLADSGAVFAGMAGRVMFDTAGLEGEALTQLLGAGCEKILPLMTGELFSLVISGTFIAIVLAAIMSTLDSLLLLAASAFIRDIYQKTIHPELSDEAMTRLCRIFTIMISFMALGIALTVSILSPSRTIFWFIIFGWSGIAATFCPVIILSLFWKGLNRAGAIAGMVSGFFGVIFFKFWPSWALAVGVVEIPAFFKDFAKMEELAPSLVVSLVAAVVVSRLSGPGTIKDDSLAGQAPQDHY